GDGPIADSCIAANISLFDYLIGNSEQGRRHLKAERLRGPEVYDELELGRLLDRQLGRPFTAQDAVHIGCRPAELIETESECQRDGQLRAHRGWPNQRCAAGSGNELPPPHSITSSARPRSGGETTIPSALAVFRLRIISILVAC